MNGINNFETQLLQKSYEHYERTHDSRFEFQTRNGDDLFYYSEAARCLAENGYIIAKSKNIFSDTIDVIRETALIFEITDRGIAWAKQNSEP